MNFMSSMNTKGVSVQKRDKSGNHNNQMAQMRPPKANQGDDDDFTFTITPNRSKQSLNTFTWSIPFPVPYKQKNPNQS